MADSRLVKDVMVPTVQLEANVRAGDALQTLDQKNIEYGVVCDESGRLLVIVTRKQLRDVEPDECVQVLTANVPHPVPIKPDDSMNSIVQMLAEDSTIKYGFTDIIVQEQGNVQGVLLHETIEEHAWFILDRVRFRGSLMSLSRPRGDPLRVPKPMLFKCFICRKKKLVEWKDYDPDNPPTCSKGHVMQRIQ